MTSRPPARIKAGAAEWLIVLKKKGSPELVDENGDALHGSCDFNACIVYAQSRLRLPKLQEVVWHEIEHICTYPTLCGRTLTDEEFVDGTAPLILQVIRENPELVRFLLA